jgi:hypothetical protein
MSVVKMSVDKMAVNEMSVDKMSVDKMSLDKMPADEMFVDKMSVDEMSVDEMTCYRRWVDFYFYMDRWCQQVFQYRSPIHPFLLLPFENKNKNDLSYKSFWLVLHFRLLSCTYPQTLDKA